MLAPVTGLVAILYALWSGASPPASPPAPAPATAQTPAPAAIAMSAAVAAEVARLDGHRVDIAPDGRSYRIVDVAGEGPPVVGVVERRGDALYLVTDAAAYRLLGPLARPRIAGPRYKVWVIGPIVHGDGAGDGDGDDVTLRPRRLGVLAPPLR